LSEEEFKYQCLVREVIRMRIADRAKAWRWLKGYFGEDGKWVKGWNDLHPESNLLKDVIDQWNKGNRGNQGDWR
jgi:hypothetical protein